MSDFPLFSASQYASICNSLPDPAFILTQSGRYAAILGGKDKRYYHDGTSLLNKYLADVLVAEKTQYFLQQIHTALAAQQMLVVEYELSVHDVLGVPVEGPAEPIWFEARITPLEHQYGDEPAVLWVASNITANKKMQIQLQQQAFSDELTGLHNRRLFMQTLEHAYRAFKQDGQPACLLSFDVDKFKAINDGWGHHVGDQALRDLAHTVQKLAASNDVVCRIGGDEFVILCQGNAVLGVTQFAQRLLEHGREVLKPYATVNSTPGLSVGIAHFSEQDASVEDIMRRVDQAMYTSKTQGGQQLSTLAAI